MHGDSYPIRSVRSHRRGEHYGPFRLQLDEHPRRSSRAVPRPVHVQLEQLLDLLHGEIQCWLMPRHSRVGDHAVEAALGFHDGLESFGHALCAGHVRVDVF